MIKLNSKQQNLQRHTVEYVGVGSVVGDVTKAKRLQTAFLFSSLLLYSFSSFLPLPPPIYLPLLFTLPPSLPTLSLPSFLLLTSPHLKSNT